MPTVAPPPMGNGETLNIFGHTLDAIHRRGLDATGRVWLLLRHLDKKGEGRVSVELIRSTLKFCSWRRIRQILREGVGTFFHETTQTDYVYLCSEARVLKELEVTAVAGWAVRLPVAELTKSIQHVRALFHDAFHSGRGDGFSKPITRGIMEMRGGMEAQTQRGYEQLRGMGKRAEYAIVADYSPEEWKRLKYEPYHEIDRRGGPPFTFVDFKGHLGGDKCGRDHYHRIYIMRRLGNAYSGTLPTVKRGRKWTNNKLSNLCNSGKARGNRFSKLFFHSEEAVSKTDEPVVYVSKASSFWVEVGKNLSGIQARLFLNA